MNEDAAAQTVIEAIDVSKVYWDGGRKLEILRRLSLSVQKGEGVAILGPSGSGKTTLLNLLSGLDKPDEGRIRLAGRELSGLGESEMADLRNEKVGFVFQFYHLLAEFTALENVLIPALISKRGRCPDKQARERAAGLLDRVGLKDRMGHFPSELSGGEQQRVAIARALMNDPEILFCDEPTGNLDPRTGEEIAGLLKHLFKNEKKAVLMVTHDERIAKMADRVWNLMNGGWHDNARRGDGS